VAKFGKLKTHTHGGGLYSGITVRVTDGRLPAWAPFCREDTAFMGVDLDACMLT